MAKNQHTTEREIRQSRRTPVNPGDCFGRLTVIEEVEPHITKKGAKYRKVKLLCDCGNVTEAICGNLSNGDIRSCGCLRKEVASRQHKTHGYHRHPLYSVWWSMNSRCYNHENVQFKNYGQRGIQVCDEWKDSPKAFIEWAGLNGWREGLYLDREMNDEGYTPSNCRFIDCGISARNRRLLFTSNLSGFRGAWLNKRTNKWVANITSNGEHYFLGYFSTAEEAAKARDAKAIDLDAGHPLNFPPKGDKP